MPSQPPKRKIYDNITSQTVGGGRGDGARCRCSRSVAQAGLTGQSGMGGGTLNAPFRVENNNNHN